MLSMNKESIIRKKKEWLRDKILAIRSSHTDTLSAFRDKLDAIVAEPLHIACTLVEQPDSALCLQQIAMVGFTLEKCNNQLFDLLLSIYPSESDNEKGAAARPNVSHVLHSLPALMPVYSSPMPLHRTQSRMSQERLDYIQVDTSTGPSRCRLSSGVYNSEDESSCNEWPQDGGSINVTQGKVLPIDQKLSVELNSTISSIHGASAKHSTPKTASTMASSEEIERQPVDETQASSPSTPSCPTESRKTFKGTVSDVISPDRFSIQVEESIPVVKRLQRKLNDFYDNGKNVSDYGFLKVPEVGEQCAVVYQPDNTWYRACVRKIIDQTLILVEYIDYGNMDDVPWCGALKLAPIFCDQPRLSMTCSLADVSPGESGSTQTDVGDGVSAWDVSAIEWFDKFAFGQTYQVVVAENQNSEFGTCVRLYYTECEEKGNPVMWNVSKLMVSLRMAVWKKSTPVVKLDEEELLRLKEAFDNEANVLAVESDTAEPTLTSPDLSASRGNSNGHMTKVTTSEHHTVFAPAKNSVPTTYSSEVNQKASVSRGDEKVASQRKNCIPAGMERTHNSMIHAKALVAHEKTKVANDEPPDTSEGRLSGLVTSSEDQAAPPTSATTITGGDKKQPSKNTPPCSDPLLTPTSSVTPELATGVQCKKEDEALKSWNPMEQDFLSLRNSYAVDTENACVATEGVDPEEVKVCHHYAKGRCWNAGKCPNVHARRSYDGEMRTEVRTYGASRLKPFHIPKGSWSLVYVTSIISTDHFYTHVIQSLSGMDECLSLCSRIDAIPHMSPHLHALMMDMKLYYTRNSKSTTAGMTTPCCGELYAVYVPEDECFYRGMILDVTYDVVKVHLIDFGRDISMSFRNLRPMCDAFMHLPRQAILCTLSGCNGQDFVKLRDFLKLARAGCIAMEVVEGVCIETDGPLSVSLYSLDKDGLHRVMT